MTELVSELIDAATLEEMDRLLLLAIEDPAAYWEERCEAAETERNELRTLMRQVVTDWADGCCDNPYGNCQCSMNRARVLAAAFEKARRA